MPTFIEKRKHSRYNVLMSIRYDVVEDGAYYPGQITNISKKGVYLISPATLDIGKKITLQIDHLNADRGHHEKPAAAYHAVVKTCHILPKSGQCTYGIGAMLQEPLPDKLWSGLFSTAESRSPIADQRFMPGFETLRRRAEEFISRDTQAVFRLGPENIQQLVHELYIHQVELQMQSDELRKAQDETQVALSQYADLYDFAPVGYFTLDRSGLIERVNITAAGFLGVERSHLIKTPLLNYIPKSDQDIFWQHRCLILESQKKHVCEISLRNKAGSTIDVQLQSVIESHKKGTKKKIFTAVIDITQRKKAEKEHEILKNRLADAHKLEAIGTLAGGVAHDFNNIMMAIQGCVSLMLLDHDEGHPHTGYLKIIDEQIKSASNLTRQLLAFAQGGKYTVRAININDLITASTNLFARTRTDIQIETDLQSDLAAVAADKTQLEQVFLNLFINAGHAMPDGGHLKISTNNIELTQTQSNSFDLPKGNYVRIMVSDTGAGMDEVTRKRIFEPFFTTKGVKRGTGLGLASVYGTIRNHKGFIEALSRPGRGSTFIIYLPATDTEAVKIAPKNIAISKGAETILVVDDEAKVREVLSQILEHLDYTVLLASSGEEALEQYRSNQDRIDMVILDMTMPGMDGSQTFERLQALDPDVQVLLASGFSQQGKAEEIVKRGCRGFIQKPYSIEALSQTLRTILDLSQ